jgi:hypothetical protein
MDFGKEARWLMVLFVVLPLVALLLAVVIPAIARR